MQIRLIPEAQQDLQEALDNYYNIDEKLEENFLYELELTYDKILKFPKLYPFETKISQKILMQTFPYIILYEVYYNDIVILAIFHTSRDSKTLFSRKR